MTEPLFARYDPIDDDFLKEILPKCSEADLRDRYLAALIGDRRRLLAKKARLESIVRPCSTVEQVVRKGSLSVRHILCRLVVLIWKGGWRERG